MKLTIRAKDLELTPDLQDFIDLKIGTLDKFYNKVLDGFVELEKVTQHHKTGPFYRAVVDLRYPNKVIRVESTKEDIKVAINWAKDELQTRIKTFKESQDAQDKRGGRELKKMSSMAPEARLAAEEGGGGRTLDESQ